MLDKATKSIGHALAEDDFCDGIGCLIGYPVLMAAALVTGVAESVYYGVRAPVALMVNDHKVALLKKVQDDTTQTLRLTNKQYLNLVSIIGVFPKYDCVKSLRALPECKPVM